MFLFFSVCAFHISQHVVHCNCHTNAPPHLKFCCLPVSIHLRPQYMVLHMTLLYSIPERRFQNELKGAVLKGSSSVKNLRMVSRVVEEMSCRLPILLCALPLQPHPETLSRCQIFGNTNRICRARGSSTKVSDQNFNIYFTHFYLRLSKF